MQRLRETEREKTVEVGTVDDGSNKSMNDAEYTETLVCRKRSRRAAVV